MTDYETGMMDALEILKAEVDKRCDILDKMYDSMRVENNGPHLADNDLGGVLNAQKNVYQGIQIAFETAAMRKINSARRKKS